MVFDEWWEQQNKTEEERIAYFRTLPAPSRWLAGMADVIGDLKPWDGEGEFDYRPYFTKLTELGFEGVANYENDLDDQKWIEMGR